VRGKIADWYVQQQGLKLTLPHAHRVVGDNAGAGSSIIKIVAAPDAGYGRLRHGLMGPAGIMKEEVPHAAGTGTMDRRRGLPHRRRHRRVFAQHRGERTLPADIRVDKDVPFNKLTRS
jgi:acyl-CoA dehydrogenase